MSENINKSQLDSLIKESIRECLKLNPQFSPTNTLVTTTYHILTNLFVNETKYIFLEAPTGSGKSVIAYLLHFCYVYINNKLFDISEGFNNDDKNISQAQNTYLLTSSKMLQSQLEGDITRFNLEKFLTMIKGVKNYECTKQTKDTGIYHNYSERACIGMSTAEKEQLDCYDTCPYIQKRFEASTKDCTILNYSFFLHSLKNPYNVYFGTRRLTIADEAHLIPDIVLGMYNIELTMYKANMLLKLINQISINFGKQLDNEIYSLRETIGGMFKIFLNPKPNLEDVKLYFLHYNLVVNEITIINDLMKTNPVFVEMFDKDIKKHIEDLKNYDSSEYLESLTLRESDCFIQTESIGNQVLEEIGDLKLGSYKVYRHNVYDLNESELCRKHFISKVSDCIFMSATLGNIEEFAIMMGLKKDEYVGFRLDSNFNFDKSPIYLTKSGYLNYTNFQKNIDKVLYDALRLCEHFHPNEKGIIHTATFQISNMLRDMVYNKLGGVTNPKRYLFYSNPEEKEACIELMKAETNINYIIIGPSLYEGIDLKDDMGRFNILIKTPYSGISDYTRKKMELYPFWYNRQTLEKLIQSIGRTNRHIDDYSTTYILDSTAEKLVFQMPEFMVKRIQFFNKL